MSESFNAKAKTYLKDFSGFPRPTHPLWKGFPQNQWLKNLESMDWKKETSSTFKESWSLDRLPFSITDFSVLGFSDKEIKWLKDEPSSVKVHLNQSQDSKESATDSFHNLSNKISKPGIGIEVSRDIQLERPILCLFFSSGEPTWNVYDHKIKLNKSSAASFIFANATESGVNSLNSHLVSSELAESSTLKIAHLNHLEASANAYVRFHFNQGRESTLEFIDLGLGVGLGRCEIHVNLNEEQAKSQVSGIHLLRDSQIYDTRIKMIHHVADTVSRQSFKCVVADKAHSLFGGHILIQKEAQRVDSSQSHKALIISKGAKSSAFPELEVHADDVKAAHGSSTGQMDPEQIFYLKSRGLTEKDSVHLLSEAFVKDVVLKQSDSKIRLFLNEVLTRSLPEFVKQMESKWREVE